MDSSANTTSVVVLDSKPDLIIRHNEKKYLCSTEKLFPIFNYIERVYKEKRAELPDERLTDGRSIKIIDEKYNPEIILQWVYGYREWESKTLFDLIPTLTLAAKWDMDSRSREELWNSKILVTLLDKSSSEERFKFTAALGKSLIDPTFLGRMQGV
jgi:hypothetical protein